MNVTLIYLRRQGDIANSGYSLTKIDSRAPPKPFVPRLLSVKPFLGLLLVGISAIDQSAYDDLCYVSHLGIPYLSS